MFFALALLAACSNDFGLEGLIGPDASGDDTATDGDGGGGDGGGSPQDGGGTQDGGGAQDGGGTPDDTGGSLDGGGEDQVGDGGDELPGDGGTPGDGGEPEDTGVVGDGGVVDDPAPEDDCTETSDLVYVLSRDDNRLYTFDPTTLSFSSLGRVDCGSSQSPGSMAVDRSGTAWVRFADNRVYGVALETMDCSPAGYSDRDTSFDSFGMGFATDSADTWREQLYIANGDTLAVLDSTSWSLRELGPMPSQSELTGNAEGELWAILPLESPAQLVQVDKDHGDVLETIRMPSFPDPSDIDTFAFATWGGSFWIFVRSYGMGESTDVYQVTGTGLFSKVSDNIGFDIVGAGVSTCAPTE